MKRWAVIAAMLLALLGVTMAPAYADPTNAPDVVPFQITCGGTTYTVVGVPGRGGWTPALVSDSNQVFIPFSFDITITDLTTGEVDTIDVSRSSGNVATQSCSFTLTTTDSDTGHLVSVVGDVVVLLTPPTG